MGRFGSELHVVYIPTVVQSYSSMLHHVNQTARSGYQQVTTSLQVPQLTTNVSSSVYHTWTNAGTIGKLR